MTASQHDGAPSPSAGPRGHSRLFGILLAAAALVAACALLLFALGQSPLVTVLARATPTATTYVPAQWQLYRDPGGYFMLQIPPDWQAERHSGAATEIIGNVTVHVPEEDVRFGPPDLSIPPTSLSIFILIYRIVSPAQRQAFCQLWHPDTTLDGLPAMSQTGFSDGWQVFTNTATYQITYGLPGDLGNTLQTALPAPLPRETVTAISEQLAEVMSTFRFVPATPITC
jgi:hypothetical protein